MKKHRLFFSLILFATLLAPGIILSQNIKDDSISGGGGHTTDADFCEDFSHSNFGGWQSNPADPDILTLSQPGPSGDPGDIFLHVTEASNETFLLNTNNYDGNWLTLGSCFCFDVIAISGVDQSIPLRFTLVIEGGLQGTAKFEFNQTVDETMGWVKFCAPIDQCTGSNLPSNDNGQWELSGGGSSCSVWNSIISNVTSVKIEYDDINFTNEVVGFDNICLGDCGEKSSSCCDATPNMIFNGNFESGNIGFQSEYDFTADYSANSIAPGMYGVASAAQALAISPNWTLEDPSSCAGLSNDRVFLVNGRTQQPVSPFPWIPPQENTLVWYQVVGNLNPGSTFQFCGKFKNLPQTAFDILPEIYILVDNPATQTYGPFTINAGSGLCDWEEISFQFDIGPTMTGVPIRIFINHFGNGDGNDLAIDDLALHELLEVDFDITVAGGTNGPGVEGSFGAAGAGDDGLFDASCNYQWRVIDQSTSDILGAGNNIFSVPGGMPWLLTTSYPGINFQPSTTYRIEMEVFDCDCQADGIKWVEVTIGPTGNVRVINSGSSGNLSHGPDPQSMRAQPDPQVSFFPNPTTGKLKAEIGNQKTDLQLVDLQGRVLRKWTLSENAELDLSDFPAGAYYLQYQSKAQSGARKVILQ